VQPGGRHLRLDLIGMVEERGSEPLAPVGLRCLAAQVAFHDGGEGEIVERPLTSPSNSEAKREMAAATTTPPSRATRRA
jgi:hypothetical protein